LKKIFFLLFLLFQTLLFADVVKSIKAVFDNDNHLMWQDNEEVLWKDDITMAKVYCNTLILNGYIDWYLPSLKQLQSIIDINNKKGFIKKQFKYVKGNKYWSNTPFIKDKKYYWYVDFQTGKTSYMQKDTQNFVRCVRDIDE
jgi:hypothetical protein